MNRTIDRNVNLPGEETDRTFVGGVDQSVSNRFERIVQLYPNNLACKIGDRSLTYDELNQYANRIAHVIVDRRGAGSEPIALFFENSVDLIAGIFAVLKAGKFYVVLDPLLPEERRQYLLNNSGAKLLISDGYHRDTVATFTGENQEFLTVDTVDRTQSSDNLDIHISPHDLECIRYTSGSTGTPKGMVELNWNVLHSVRWMTEEIKVSTNDRFSLTHSLSFASGHINLRLALLNGASLFGFDVRGENLTQFARWLRDERITILHLPPALFRQLAESLPAGEMYPALRLIRLSGAPITTQDFELYKSRFVSGTRLHIGMGSTEARGICAAIVDHNFLFPSNGSPIGYPPPGKKILLLDETGGEVAPGQVGEIGVKGSNQNFYDWFGSPPRGEGALMNPEGGGEKVYLTGDLGRMMPDGFVIHLGRKDLMVKIRGYRVDISEVERALLEHPGIQEAAVRAWEREDGEKYLAAYMVARAESVLNVGEIRESLSSKLPDYMIPTAMQFVEALPLTNGKLDRRALPKPDSRRPELRTAYLAPRNETEQKLTEIWSEVMAVEQIGVSDSFFDLGGHSLTAIRLISRIIQVFQLELSVKALFQTPTIAAIAAILVAARKGTRPERKGLDTMAAVRISRRSSRESAPLSFAQEQLWFLNQLEPGSTVYNEPRLIRLNGALDVKALEKSLDHIIARHEVLRTTIEQVDGCPMQRIAEHRSINLPVLDVRSYGVKERNTEAQRVIEETIRRPFNLSTDLVLRVLLVRLSDREHLFVLVKHHIASDGWSSEIFWREFADLYRAYTFGESVKLPAIAVQYADYATWQREWLKGDVLEEQISYWKRQLAGVSDLSLPTDHPRPAVPDHRGARESITLCTEFSDKIKELSRSEGATLYMTLLAAFQTLLYRYTGQEDIAVGSPIANRRRRETEELIGFFVNTLVLRTDFSGHPTFKAMLQRVKETTIEAYAHQDLPFERVVEELHPERSLSYSPVFQVMFNMNEPRESNIDLPGLTTEWLSFSAAESKFDFTLYAKEQKDEIHFDVVYRVDLFSGMWMTSFLQQYRYLLEQIAGAPENTVDSYSLVTPESKLLLPDPNTVLAEPLQKLVTDICLSWAERTPAQVAISQGEEMWTYKQLAERAYKIGQALVSMGLTRGDVVVVYGRRGLGLIASTLGTLMSGGVLLLIDPQLPDQRKQLMLKEGRARWILFVGDEDRSWANPEQWVDSLSIESVTGAIVDCDRSVDLETVCLPKLSLHDSAYIFFTSGTTGIPKAVLGCHKGLSHFLNWQRQTFAITASDRVAQLTNLSFDPVLRDIFLPLTSGATLCLPEATVDPATSDTIGWLQRERISILHTVPSLAEAWLASAQQSGSLPDLRWVFFAGEALTDSLVAQWRSRLQSDAKIVNLYGPTETTLVKCFYRVPAEPPSGVQPVGLPIPGAQVLVLTPERQLCGVNEPGEIVLRTPFRSLGYLNAAEENRKRFVANPFRDDPEDLIYFTGDAGRYRPDGTLEILGRLDDQIKIRGVRVEPAEVTATLLEHPAVTSCVVVGRKNERGETSLVAYVTPEANSSTPDQLRSYLLERLPSAMVPSTFVHLKTLPLTPNGKVNRKALPDPPSRTPEVDNNFVAPRNPLEETIAGIWAEVLKTEKVGVHDNFFDAGGHSLLAVRVLSRMSRAFELTLPLKVLFESPTVARLAKAVENNQAPGATPGDLELVVADLENMSEKDAQQVLAKVNIH